MDGLSAPTVHLYQDAPAWVIILVLAGAILVALELGHRAGRVWPIRGNLSALQTAVFGLATLLLAFSFSAAESRFEERRNLAVREANAIGTLYLRAAYLPPKSRDEMRGLLRRYLDVHLEVTDPTRSRAELARLKLESDRLQNQLWAIVERQAHQLSPAVLLLITPSLNEVIDVSAMRWATALVRLPWLVLAMLFTVTVASALLVSYQPGSTRRDLPQWTVFGVTSVVVILTLLDLDRPPKGFIQTSQQPLIELQLSLRQPPP